MGIPAASMKHFPVQRVGHTRMGPYPPLPEPAQAVARAQAGERYDAFVAALGRRLAKRPKLRQEISEDISVMPDRQ